MHRARRRMGLAVGVGSLSLAAVLAGPAAVAQESKPTSEISKTLHRIVAQQADAWNRGDLEGFMAAYWRSEGLTFSSGGNTTRGWEATLDRYRQRYQNGIGMGTLEFSDLETTELGAEAAMMLGRWRLQVDDQTLGGNFTLVWRRIDDEWKIIHDHTSSVENADSVD